MSENQSPRLMLMFTVGPVQSFIEAARKTEDLWMGSYILSYLIATAMEKIQGEGVEIIYPAIGTDSPFDFWREQDLTTPSFPNLFLAVGDGIAVSQGDLVERAKEAEKSVKTEFELMAQHVLDKVFGTWRDNYVAKLFEKQISDFFDIYWVITEEETDQKYGDWYDYTASSLAAVKNCRTFMQTLEVGRKCSLDGTREILHLQEDDSIKDAMTWWDKFSKDTPKYCRQKEALCAVSLTKRMGMHFLENYSKFSKEFTNSRPRFPSTSEVATANYKEQILCKPDALEVYTKFCDAVKYLRQSDDKDAKIPTIQPLPKIKCPLPNNVDGEWLYEETMEPAYLERYYNVDVLKAADQIEQCKELRKKLVQLLKGEPGKYYAAIALDADNMGEVNRNAESQEQHAKNSKQLINYAKKARRIVEEKHLGKLTYAGGDDLLALANLKDLLSILKKLHKKFPDFTTISAGVCIAHNKMPLGDVLQHARRMEKKAKNNSGRDAIGIALFKRSGNVSEMVTKWNHGDLEVLAVGQKLAMLLQDDEISKRFLYTFRDALAKLIGDDKDLMIELPSELVDKEFKRIIERAYKTKGQQLDKRSQRAINQTLEMWVNFNTFTEYINFLEIITFISRESK